MNTGAKQMTTATQAAYHRHTGQPLGLVTEVEAKGFRGIKGLGRFVVAKRDAILKPATAQQIEMWSA
jgi:hypothetical protein